MWYDKELLIRTVESKPLSELVQIVEDIENMWSWSSSHYLLCNTIECEATRRMILRQFDEQLLQRLRIPYRREVTEHYVSPAEVVYDTYMDRLEQLCELIYERLYWSAKCTEEDEIVCAIDTTVSELAAALNVSADDVRVALTQCEFPEIELQGDKIIYTYKYD
jgi:hypothetical protein